METFVIRNDIFSLIFAYLTTYKNIKNFSFITSMFQFDFLISTFYSKTRVLLGVYIETLNTFCS